MTSKLGFPMGRTVQLFGTKGQKFFHCPGTKGQRDRLRILPRDGTQDKMGQSRKGVLEQENGVLKQEKDVLKQENDVKKQEIWSFFEIL